MDPKFLVVDIDSKEQAVQIVHLLVSNGFSRFTMLDDLAKHAVLGKNVEIPVIDDGNNETGGVVRKVEAEKKVETSVAEISQNLQKEEVQDVLRETPATELAEKENIAKQEVELPENIEKDVQPVVLVKKVEVSDEKTPEVIDGNNETEGVIRKETPVIEISGKVPDEEYQDTCNKVRALMDKISENNSMELQREFVSLDISFDKPKLENVAELIVEKCVKEPERCHLYAKLCKSQVDHELKLTDGKASDFRSALLNGLRNIVENGKEKSNEDILELMTLLGNVYLNEMVPSWTVQALTYELLWSIRPRNGLELKKEDIDEQSVLYGLRLLEITGERFDKEYTNVYLDQWFQDLTSALPFFSDENRKRCTDLMDLRANKWIRN